MVSSPNNFQRRSTQWNSYGKAIRPVKFKSSSFEVSVKWKKSSLFESALKTSKQGALSLLVSLFVPNVFVFNKLWIASASSRAEFIRIFIPMLNIFRRRSSWHHFTKRHCRKKMWFYSKTWNPEAIEVRKKIKLIQLRLQNRSFYYPDIQKRKPETFKDCKRKRYKQLVLKPSRNLKVYFIASLTFLIRIWG